MAICPIHNTPLNGDGDCLPCDIASGKYDDSFIPGTPEYNEHMMYKTNARQRELAAVDNALAEIEAHEQDPPTYA